MATPNVFLSYVQYACAHLFQNLSKNPLFEVQSNFGSADFGLDKAKPQDNLDGWPRILTQYQTKSAIQNQVCIILVWLGIIPYFLLYYILLENKSIFKHFSQKRLEKKERDTTSIYIYPIFRRIKRENENKKAKRNALPSFELLF